MKRFKYIFSIFLLVFFCAISGLSQVDAKVTISASKKTVMVGDVFNIKLKGVKSTSKITWKIGNTKILKKQKTTKNSIRLKALKTGTTNVRAKIGAKALRCRVSVKSVINCDSYDDFSDALAEMIKNNPVDAGTGIADADDFITCRLIVKGKSSDMDFSSYSPAEIIRSDDNVYILQFSTKAAAKSAFKEIVSLPGVEWAEADSYVGANDTYTDGIYELSNTLSWGVSVLGTDDFAQTVGSGSVTVAVVDTGVAAHSFIGSRLLTGYDYVNNDSDATDEHSHGTHVAGTIVDVMQGANVKILPVRVLDANGYGTTTSIALGIRYAADHGANVINLSLGGGHSSYMEQCINYALEKEVTVVAASGNNYSDNSSFCPAHMTNIIVVGAIDSNYQKADFSNYGNSVDVVAPGVDIYSSVPGGYYEYMSGTSMATPHISAVAALLKLKYQSAGPAQIEKMIKSSARDLGTSGWDIYYGYGVPYLSGFEYTDTDDTTDPDTTEPTTPDPTPTPTPDPVIPDPVIPDPVTPDPDYPNNPDPGLTPVVPEPIDYDPNPDNDRSGYFIYRTVSGGVEITGYSGNETEIVIPAKLDGKKVVSIGMSAFVQNPYLTTLTIEADLTSIGMSAFAQCMQLTTINIKGSVETFDMSSFTQCMSLKVIYMNSKTKTIGMSAFAQCYALSAIFYDGTQSQYSKLNVEMGNEQWYYAVVYVNG